MFTSIFDYKKWFEQELTTDTINHLHLMEEIVRNLGQSHQLITLLKLILDDPEQLDQVASQSYIHYNGFDKLVLLSSTSPQYKLRLHVWWPSPDQSVTTENIHNHRWDFSSIILIGAYRKQEYQLSDEGVETYSYRYFSPKGQDHYSMDFLDIKKLTCTLDEFMTAGTSYTLPHTILHRITSPRQKLTATLMLQGPAIKESTDVFSYQKIHNPSVIDSLPLSSFVLSQKIENLLTILEHTDS